MFFSDDCLIYLTLAAFFCIEPIYDTEKCSKFEISNRRTFYYGNLLHQ